MRKKVIYITCIILSLIVIYSIYDNVKQSYYFKQTENIYREFERVFVNHDFNDYNKHLKTDVENIIYDISKYGDNFECVIKKISNNIYDDIGYIKYSISEVYYDLNHNVIYSSNPYDNGTYIIVKKVKGTWVIYDIYSEEEYYWRKNNGSLYE